MGKIEPPAILRAAARGARDRAKVALTRYPAAHRALRRPYAVARYWLRRPHDPDYAAFRLFGDRPGMFIDVGANAGMSALSFRLYDRTRPILSIEPNPYHEDDLRFVGRLARPFHYLIFAAGSAAGETTLYVPLMRGVPMTSEATTRTERAANRWNLRARLGGRAGAPAIEVADVAVAVRRLDEYGLDAGIVKVDVQGSEYEALLGMTETIRRCRPVLLVETSDPRVFALLAERGYAAHHYVAATGRLEAGAGAGPNVFFLPSP